MEEQQPTDQIPPSENEASKEPSTDQPYPWHELDPSLSDYQPPYEFFDPEKQITIAKQIEEAKRTERSLYGTGATRPQAAFLTSTALTHPNADRDRAKVFLLDGGNRPKPIRLHRYGSEETESDEENPDVSPLIVRGKHGIGAALSEDDTNSKDNIYGPPLGHTNGPANKTRAAMREYLAQKPTRSLTLAARAQSASLNLPHRSYENRLVPAPINSGFQSETSGLSTFVPHPVYNSGYKTAENPAFSQQSSTGSQHQGQSSTSGHSPDVKVAKWVPYDPNRAIMRANATKVSEKLSSVQTETILDNGTVPSTDVALLENLPGVKTYEQIFDEIIEHPSFDDPIHKANEEFILSLYEKPRGVETEASVSITDQKHVFGYPVAHEKELKYGSTAHEGHHSNLADRYLEGVATSLAANTAANPIVFEPESVPRIAALHSCSCPRTTAMNYGHNVVRIDRAHYHFQQQQAMKALEESRHPGLKKTSADPFLTLPEVPFVCPKPQDDISVGSNSASSRRQVRASSWGIDIVGNSVKRGRIEEILILSSLEQSDIDPDEDDLENKSDGELDAYKLFPELYQK